MNDKRNNRKRVNDSTTDFFLNVMKKEESERKEEENVESTFDEKTNNTLNKIGHAYNYFNKALDKLLANNRNILFVSIGLTLILYFVVTGGDVLSSPTSGSTIEDVPIVVEGLDDDYEVLGLLDSITVGLIGPSLDIYSTKLSGEYQVVLDVSGRDEGEYTINLEAENFGDTLTVMLVPSSLKVTIAQKETQTFTLGYEFINSDEMSSEYSVSLDSMDFDTVTISASEQTLSEIAYVNACIDVSGVTSDFEQDATIKAYNEDGGELDVDLSATSVHVSCIVSSYSKEVSIKPEFVGDLKSGYALANYTLSSSTVKIYGIEEKLNDISEVTCEIDISDLDSSTSINGVELIKVDGIDKLSSDTIDVTLEIENSITKKIEDIEIKVLNKSSNTTVSFVGENNLASVSITGAESLVSDITEENIEVTIDVDGLSVGSQKVSVNAAIDNEQLTISLLSSEKISITIERK